MANREYIKFSTIKHENGELPNTNKDIESMCVQHFQNITPEKNPYMEQSIREIIRHILMLVSREDNFNLNRPITEEDVSKVLKDM